MNGSATDPTTTESTFVRASRSNALPADVDRLECARAAELMAAVAKAGASVPEERTLHVLLDDRGS